MSKNVLNNHIEKVLAEAGLSKSERNVYLAGSAKGSSSATLQSKTNLPRPTLMAALKTLRDVGLCETYQRDGRSFFYVMLPLVALKPYLGKRQKHIDDLLEELDSINITLPSKEIVQEAAGQEEVIELLEQALRCRSRKWQVMAPKNNALAYLPKEYSSYFKRMRAEQRIVTQTLWQADIKHVQQTLKSQNASEQRVVPPAISHELPSLTICYDNSLLAITGTHNPTATLITNKSLAESFRVVFEMSWRSAGTKTIE